MSELHRLLDDELGGAERALLDSATDDLPRPGVRDDLLLKLGVTAAVLGTASTAGAATAGGVMASAAAGGAALPAVTGTVSFTAAVIVKWVGIGVVAGAVASGTAATVSSAQRASEPRASQTSVAATRAAHAPARAERTHAAGPETPAPVQSPEPTEPAPVRAAPAASRPAITRELAMLDRARSELSRSQPDAALSTIAAYRREFPAGALLPEAQLLQIQGLAARGDHAQAAHTARQFLQQQPKSPHTGRVRALLRRTTTGPAIAPESAPAAVPNVASFPPEPK